jgi:TRAP-type mannitol/chloroaromatic compound transport system permease small subunit
MEWMQKIVQGIDRINRRVGRGIAWVSFFMVVVVTVDVIMRYLFRTSFVFVQELEWHLFGVLFLVGAGYTLLHDDHVRVDIFYQRLTKKQKAWINFLGTLIFLLPGCYLVVATSWNFVMNSWSVREASPDPGGIPARYILKSAIPIGFFLIALQGISMGIKSLLIILGYPTDSEKEGRS